LSTIYETLYRTFKEPFSVSSNFSRYRSQEIGALASLGLITTKVGRKEYGRLWRITEEGIETLRIEGYL